MFEPDTFGISVNFHANRSRQSDRRSDTPYPILYVSIDRIILLVFISKICFSTVMSFEAVNADGRMIGVSLNALLTRDRYSLEPPESEQLLELEKYKDLKFRKIVQLLQSVYWQSNMFKSHPDINRVLEIKILSVDSSCRGQGVAKALIKRTMWVLCVKYRVEVFLE